MFITYNYKRQHNPHNITTTLLLLIDILRGNTRPEPSSWVISVIGAFALTGLSGSLQASPENMQISHVEPRLYLNISAKEPLTLLKAIDRSKVSGQSRHQGYDLDPDVASADAATSGKLSDYFPSKVSLTREGISVATPFGGKLDSVLTDTQGVKLTAATLSSVDKLANNIDAVRIESEDNSSHVEKPIVTEVVRSPFVAITLAGLALLGLVSVSRRNDL